jgi:hypothetical protein
MQRFKTARSSASPPAFLVTSTRTGSSFRKYLVPVTSDSFTFCRRFRAIRASLPI